MDELPPGSGQQSGTYGHLSVLNQNGHSYLDPDPPASFYSHNSGYSGSQLVSHNVALTDPQPLKGSSHSLEATASQLQVSTPLPHQGPIAHLMQAAALHSLQCSTSHHFQPSSHHLQSSITLPLQSSSSHHLQATSSQPLQLTAVPSQPGSSLQLHPSGADHVTSSNNHSFQLSPLQSINLHNSTPHGGQELGDGSSGVLPPSSLGQPSLVLQGSALHQQADSQLELSHSSVALGAGLLAVGAGNLGGHGPSHTLGLEPSDSLGLARTSPESLHLGHGTLHSSSGSGGLGLHLSGGNSLHFSVTSLVQAGRDLASPPGPQYAPVLLPESPTPPPGMLSHEGELRGSVGGAMGAGRGACMGGLGESITGKEQLTYQNSCWKDSLHSSISNLYETQCLCDLVLAVGPHEIKTHKLVLGAASGIMQEMLEKEESSGSLKISIIADVDLSSLKTFLQFLYCGEVKVNSFNARELLDLAQIFKISSLIHICKDAMKRLDLVESGEKIVPELSLSVSSLQKPPLMVDAATSATPEVKVENKTTSTEDLCLVQSQEIQSAMKTEEPVSPARNSDASSAVKALDRKPRSGRSPQTTRVPSHSYGTRAATNTPKGRVSAGKKIKDTKMAKVIADAAEEELSPLPVAAENNSSTRKRGRPPKKALNLSSLCKSEPIAPEVQEETVMARGRRGGKKAEAKMGNVQNVSEQESLPAIMERKPSMLNLTPVLAAPAAAPEAKEQKMSLAAEREASSSAALQGGLEGTSHAGALAFLTSSPEGSAKSLQGRRKTKSKRLSWSTQDTVRPPPKKRAKMEMKRLSELSQLSGSEDSSEAEDPPEDIQAFMSRTRADRIPLPLLLPEPPVPAAPQPKAPESAKGKRPKRRAGQHDGTVRKALELENRAADIPEAERQYKCTLCGNEFVFAKRSVTHLLRTHHVSLEDVANHVIIRTRESDPKVCDICGYETKEPGFYYIHYHKYFRHGVPLPQGWRPFTCEECGKECFTKFQLQDHRRTHSERTPYVCELCGQGFRSRTSYNSHIFHRHTTERKHGCPTCGKHFKTRTQMRVHMRTHTGEKPFACPRCAYRSTTRGNMRLHLTNRHKLDAATVKPIMAALTATAEPLPQSAPQEPEEEEEETVAGEGGAGEVADPSMALAASIVEAALRNCNYRGEDDKPLIGAKAELSAPIGLLSTGQGGQTMFMLPEQSAAAALGSQQMVAYTLVNGSMVPVSAEKHSSGGTGGRASPPGSPHGPQPQTTSLTKTYLQHHSPISPPPPPITLAKPYGVGCGEDLSGVGMVAAGHQSSHGQVPSSVAGHMTSIPSSTAGHQGYDQVVTSPAQQQYDPSLMYYHQQQYYQQTTEPY